MLANWRTSPSLSLAALVGITAVWGYTFLIVKSAVAVMPVMDFMAWRFAAAALVMLALRPGCIRGITRLELLRGCGLGLVLGLGYITQTYGLLYASAAVSGFITGMFVVLTPVVAWIILHHKTDIHTWFMVGLATVGVALLSLNGWSIGIGELLTLACAILFAVHIVGLGEWSPDYDPYTFAFLQIATVAVISIIAAVPGGITPPPNIEVWITIGITAVFATALAFIVQTWAQSLVSPVRAAIVMTMEPVFAGLFAVVIGGEQLTFRTVLGGICIVIAMLVVSLKSTWGTAQNA